MTPPTDPVLDTLKTAFQSVQTMLKDHHSQFIQRIDKHEKEEWNMLGELFSKLDTSAQAVEELREETDAKFFRRDIALAVMAVAVVIIAVQTFF